MALMTYRSSSRNVIAGETLSQYSLVYLNTVDSRYYLADSNSFEQVVDCTGIVLHTGGIAEGESGAVQIASGLVNNSSWSWQPGQRLYVGASGTITTDPFFYKYSKTIGYAVTATQISFDPQIGWSNVGDEIEVSGDQLEIDYVPDGYIPTLTAETSSIRHLGSHLKGINNRILINSSTDQQNLIFTPTNFTSSVIDGVTTSDDQLGSILKGIDDKFYMDHGRVSILDFGGCLDGVNDDTDATQAAIDYIKVNGGCLYYPPNSSSKLLGTINIYDMYSLSIEFNMSSINCQNTSSPTFNIEACRQVSISKGIFGGQGSTLNQIYIGEDCWGITISGCYLSWALTGIKSYKCRGLVIDNCNFSGVSSGGFETIAIDTNWVQPLTISNCAFEFLSWPIIHQASDICNITQNYFESSDYIGIQVNQDPAAATWNETRSVISNNYFINSNIAQIDVIACRFCKISGNVFCSVDSVDCVAINVQSLGRNVLIDGNYFYTSSGIYKIKSRCSDTIVTKTNRIYQNYTIASSSSYYIETPGINYIVGGTIKTYLSSSPEAGYDSVWAYFIITEIDANGGILELEMISAGSNLTVDIYDTYCMNYTTLPGDGLGTGCQIHITAVTTSPIDISGSSLTSPTSLAW
jgi:hypothetical protein